MYPSQLAILSIWTWHDLINKIHSQQVLARRRVTRQQAQPVWFFEFVTSLFCPVLGLCPGPGLGRVCAVNPPNARSRVIRLWACRQVLFESFQRHGDDAKNMRVSGFQLLVGLQVLRDRPSPHVRENVEQPKISDYRKGLRQSTCLVWDMTKYRNALVELSHSLRWTLLSWAFWNLNHILMPSGVFIGLLDACASLFCSVLELSQMYALFSTSFPCFLTLSTGVLVGLSLVLSLFSCVSWIVHGFVTRSCWPFPNSLLSGLIQVSAVLGPLSFLLSLLDSPCPLLASKACGTHGSSVRTMAGRHQCTTPWHIRQTVLRKMFRRLPSSSGKSEVSVVTAEPRLWSWTWCSCWTSVCGRRRSVNPENPKASTKFRCCPPSRCGAQTQPCQGGSPNFISAGITPFAHCEVPAKQPERAAHAALPALLWDVISQTSYRLAHGSAVGCALACAILAMLVCVISRLLPEPRLFAVVAKTWMRTTYWDPETDTRTQYYMTTIDHLTKWYLAFYFGLVRITIDAKRTVTEETRVSFASFLR